MLCHVLREETILRLWRDTYVGFCQYNKVANHYGLSVRTTEFDLFHSLTA